MDTLLAMMRGLGPALCLWIFFTFVLAGCVKGLVGLGLPTVAIGLLSLTMPPAQAASLLLLPSLLTNVLQTRGAALPCLLRRFAVFLLASAVGTLVSGLLLGPMASAWAGRALGAVLIAYAVSGALSLRLRALEREGAVTAALCGAATGALCALSGVFVLPAVPYLQARGLSRDELIQVLRLSFTVSTLALGAVLWQAGEMRAGTGYASLAVVLPAWLGMMLGQTLRRHLSAALFKRCFFAGIGALGLGLLYGGH